MQSEMQHSNNRTSLSIHSDMTDMNISILWEKKVQEKTTRWMSVIWLSVQIHRVLCTCPSQTKTPSSYAHNTGIDLEILCKKSKNAYAVKSPNKLPSDKLIPIFMNHYYLCISIITFNILFCWVTKPMPVELR